jgi:acetyltransferase-like isoleucine patch superfamily enzyme
MSLITVGAYTYGQENISAPYWGSRGGHGKLIIGKYCSIAAGVTVLLGGNHRTDWVTTYPFGHIHEGTFPCMAAGHPATKGDVRIGNDVWLGMRSTIMSGVTIGDGAVVAANSHVVKDVPPYTIVGGNPARPIRQRFRPDQVESLLAIRWWDWPTEKVAAHVELLCAADIDAFIAAANA